MNRMDHLRDSIGQAINALAEGWQSLKERAGQALTHFRVNPRGGAVQTAEEQVAMHGARWGLLAAEVREDDQHVIVRLEAPGMESDDFQIAILEDRVLHVHGEKRVQRNEIDGRFHIMECAYGRFERVIPLPAEVNEHDATASYRNGVLRVELTKRGRTTPGRRIPVEVG